MEVAKKANDQANEIYVLQNNLPGNRDRVVSNQMTAATESEPKTSSMQTVERRVCHVNGHQICQIDRQVPNTELADPSKAFHRTTITKQELICLHCGMTLEEIRTAK